uniref:Uncharacterized protein n=1 Tax=Ciona intestinalis TaxID=7719 RepID=H2XJJ9_CIOIN
MLFEHNTYFKKSNLFAWHCSKNHCLMTYGVTIHFLSTNKDICSYISFCFNSIVIFIYLYILLLFNKISNRAVFILQILLKKVVFLKIYATTQLFYSTSKLCQVLKVSEFCF